MNYYSRLSIKTKIIILAVFVSSIVSIVSILTFYNYDKAEILKREIRDVEAISELVSSYSGVYVQFNNSVGVDKILNSFDSLSHITQIKVFSYDPVSKKHNKKPFSTFAKPTPDAHDFIPFLQPKDTVWVTGHSFAVFKKVMDKDNSAVIGTVIVVASLDFYREQKRRVWMISIGMIFVSVLFATLLVLALQGYISRPLLQLSGRVYDISKAKNYGIESLKQNTADEVQQLSFAFHKMLEKIEKDNAQLVEAKEAALMSLKAKDEFLAKMSHEIRTPLNAVMGLSNLLEQTSLDEDQMFYVKSIRSSSDNLLVIINEILDFSKIQAGKLAIEKAPFNLSDLLESFVSSTKIGINEKWLGFHFAKPDDLPEWIIGDSVRLNQILLNLVSNAIKFTEKGEVSIRVDLEKQIDNKVQIKFTITDTGIGIPKEKLADIFGSFNQASSSTTRRYGGTGLGLTIARQLVELQGGNLGVESEVGVGSTFFFSLIFELVDNPQKSLSVEKDDAEKLKEQIKDMSLTILLVEDNKLNRILAKRILENLGIEVIEANDGREAINKLREHTVDLILMDLHMPEMDGYNTTAYIRKKFDAPISELPIIALTAAATKGEVEKCFEYGMNEFVSKPINTETLIGKIVSLVKK